MSLFGTNKKSINYSLYLKLTTSKTYDRFTKSK